MPKPKTVKYMAKEAGIDLDEALLLFWENDLNNLGPDDSIPPSQMRRARAALGLPDIRHIRRADYWCGLLGIKRSELEDILRRYNLRLPPNARNLPKGGIAAMRRYSNIIIHPSIPTKAVEETDIHSFDQSISVVHKPIIWRNIGRVAPDIRFLERDDVIRIYNELVREFSESSDPISPASIRDVNMLDSAISRPHTKLGKARKYPTVEMAGAALLHAIIHNHPFSNGNKRTGFVSTAAFLYNNGFRLTCSQNEAFQIVLKVAKHKLINVPDLRYTDLADREMLELSQWLNQNTRRIEKGELVIKWHELKRILRKFNVDFKYNSGGGSFIDLARNVPPNTNSKRITRRDRRKPTSFYTQVKFTDDGRDVSRNTIKKIRKDLKLDEESGTDSRDFYSKSGSEFDMIIHDYQTILYQLAKVG